MSEPSRNVVELTSQHFIFMRKKAFSSLPNSRNPAIKDWELLSSKWREDLNQKIAYLENLRDSLTGCIGCGYLSMKKCPIYNEQDKLSSKGSGAVLLDLLGK